MKNRTIESSLSILKQIEERLLEGMARKTRHDTLSQQSQHFSHRLQDSIQPQKQQFVCQCQITANRHRQTPKKDLDEEVSQLKCQIRHLKKYVKFLQDMNRHLKLQLKSTFVTAPTTVEHKSPIVMLNPRDFYPQVQQISSENQYLKKINKLQEEEIENLRETGIQMSQQCLVRDIYDYVTPQRRLKIRTTNRGRLATQYTDSESFARTQSRQPRSSSISHFQNSTIKQRKLHKR